MKDSLHDSAKIYGDFLKKSGIEAPKLLAVLGTGIGANLQDSWIPKNWKLISELEFSKLPGMSAASAPGHKGSYRFFQNEKTKKVFALQVGRLHGYEGLTAKQVTSSVLTARLNGTEKFILTNAAGGLKTNWSVGSIMMITDHVNMTGQNPLVGPVQEDASGKPLGPRFPELSKGWNPEFNKKIHTHMKESGLEVHEGIYLGLLGPSFETPAEIRLFANWGMGTVGMSTVWEAIALNHSGATVGGFSLISNLGCGLDPNQKLDHFEIMDQSKIAAEKIIRGLFALAESECG